jgi:molecular chaperone DnaK
VEVHVLQGERSLARDNKSLGRFHLAGIPPAPRNVPQVQVTFDIDANGIMNVAAKDLGTGRSQSITITGAGTLTKDEIDRMVKEAEAMKDQDEKVKEDAETKNKADSLAYNVEKNLKDLGDKIEGMERDRLQNMVNDLRNAIQSNDMDNVRTLMQQLEQESYKLAEQIYKTTGAGPDGQTDGSGQVPPQDGAEGQQGSSEEVIDAEFKEK